MQAMADGLAGHEHDFYVYVSNSRWLYASGEGGTDYSNLNEALPYWFNGIVPLAYSLDDPRLKSQVHDVATTVLDLQSEDGWIGPESPAERNFWARTPFFLGLTQLVEANSTWEAPVLEGLRKFMNLTNSMLHDNSFGFTQCASDVDCRWGQVRVADLIISIQWILEKYPSNQDSILWDNMQMFYNQTQFKWDAWYSPASFPQIITDPTPSNPSFPYLHGVNVGQGLKASAVIRRFNHNESLVETSMDAVNWTLTYHGAPSGTILADEIERDLEPYMGSELCTAVETGYSLAYLYQALGLNYYADRAERVILNALPVMLTEDKWAHQYMDQPNGPWTNITSTSNSPSVFTTSNFGIATTFGMEPQYPCCTVNHGQGYPKFLTHSWAAVGDSGIAHTLLSPSIVRAPVANGLVTVECKTEYPLGNTFTYTVTSNTSFYLYIRVPSWYIPEQSSLTINGISSSLDPDPSTGMHKLVLSSGDSTITYTPGVKIRTEARSNGSLSVYVGNLLYALDVGSANTSSLPHPYYNATGPGLDSLPFPQLRDYYIYNTSAWNVAVDPTSFEHHTTTDGSTPYIRVQGCQIAWGLYLDVTPDSVPFNPECIGQKSSYKLVPYGTTKVHMSELPVVDLANTPSPRSQFTVQDE
ncbi:hypothetical protein F5884DRAFT_302928 [Xylogone sp. PMI_703]|nr:hypothetical protein F5884DRAFT_302928 [Xylogone sp. PMI_703]